MSVDKPEALLHALLFLQAEPVAIGQVGLWLGVPDDIAERVVENLMIGLENAKTGVVLERGAAGVRLTTRPELGEELVRRLGLRAPQPLSHASWEVLAIVAYRQPVTRLEIEDLRQTGSERTIQTLLDRQLIEEIGRKETPGRPILYGTTVHFLQEFGLARAHDLPPLPDTPDA